MTRPGRARPTVSVCGSGQATDRELSRARRVGRELARRDVVLVCGGLGGVMAAAARGVTEEGGTVVGLLPGCDRKDANPDVTIPIPTGLGEARNALVAAAGQALIAIGGRLGTLSEIALALKWGRPVIGLDSWELPRERTGSRTIQVASSPEDAVEKALAAIESGS